MACKSLVVLAACCAEWVFVSSILQRNDTASVGGAMQVLVGQNRLVAG